MRIFFEVVAEDHNTTETLTLSYDYRQKSRFKTQLDNGEEVSLLLPRGKVLRHGNILRSEDGKRIKVIAAKESVSTIYSSDQFALMRACYHLGNRHVPLQIEHGYVRYQKDHVLDGMVSGLGLSVQHETASFEPEAGAYAQH